ncbi:MAG: cytochrome c [Elusimicrobiota bacterium]
MRARLLIMLIGTSACGPSTPPGTHQGKAYFTQAGCAACHKIGSQGSAVGPDLTLIGWRQTSQWLDLWLQDPQAWKPDTLMPNPRLPPAARQAIVTYLSERQGQDWAQGERPWDAPALSKNPVARGRVIFARAGCIGCHGADGSGGFPNRHAKGGVIPRLDRVAEGYSKTELIEKIRTGVSSPQAENPHGPAPMIRMPAWKEKLDASELDAVASFLLELSSSKMEKMGW